MCVIMNFMRKNYLRDKAEKVSRLKTRHFSIYEIHIKKVFFDCKTKKKNLKSSSFSLRYVDNIDSLDFFLVYPYLLAIALPKVRLDDSFLCIYKYVISKKKKSASR